MRDLTQKKFGSRRPCTFRKHKTVFQFPCNKIRTSTMTYFRSFSSLKLIVEVKKSKQLFKFVHTWIHRSQVELYWWNQIYWRLFVAAVEVLLSQFSLRYYTAHTVYPACPGFLFSVAPGLRKLQRAPTEALHRLILTARFAHRCCLSVASNIDSSTVSKSFSIASHVSLESWRFEISNTMGINGSLFETGFLHTVWLFSCRYEKSDL